MVRDCAKEARSTTCDRGHEPFAWRTSRARPTRHNAEPSEAIFLLKVADDVLGEGRVKKGKGSPQHALQQFVHIGAVRLIAERADGRLGVEADLVVCRAARLACPRRIAGEITKLTV